MSTVISDCEQGSMDSAEELLKVKQRAKKMTLSKLCSFRTLLLLILFLFLLAISIYSFITVLRFKAEFPIVRAEVDELKQQLHNLRQQRNLASAVAAGNEYEAEDNEWKSWVMETGKKELDGHDDGSQDKEVDIDDGEAVVEQREGEMGDGSGWNMIDEDEKNNEIASDDESKHEASQGKGQVNVKVITSKVGNVGRSKRNAERRHQVVGSSTGNEHRWEDREEEEEGAAADGRRHRQVSRGRHGDGHQIEGGELDMEEVDLHSRGTRVRRVQRERDRQTGGRTQSGGGGGGGRGRGGEIQHQPERHVRKSAGASIHLTFALGASAELLATLKDVGTIRLWHGNLSLEGYKPSPEMSNNEQAYIYKAWSASGWTSNSDFIYRPNDGRVVVQRDGVYFIYSQILYVNAAARSSYEIMIDDQRFVRCFSSVDVVPTSPAQDNLRYKTCYTGAATHLRANQTVYIKELYSRFISTDPHSNYFGLFKIVDLS